MWGTGLYSIVVLAATQQAVATKQVPKLFVPPLVIGGFVLSYMADMAYGTKMVRVRNEAEVIFLRSLLIRQCY